jgi:DNA-3-methyladenine glycosylase I
MQQKYKEIFTQTENSLRKNSGISKEQFDSRFGKFKDFSYKNMQDKDVFWILVYVAFYSGSLASMVTRKLPHIEKYLYDFKKVKNYSKREIEEYLKDPNVIRHGRKIIACINNAKEFDKLLDTYGSFSKYLESFGLLSNEEVIERLRADLRSRFQYLGKTTVNHFLTDLGLNVLKPDRVICRIFSRLGFIGDVNNIAQAIRVGRDIAAATSYPIRYIDIIFVTYGQMGDDGICLEKNPKCSVCGIKEHCNYYAERLQG